MNYLLSFFEKYFFTYMVSRMKVIAFLIVCSLALSIDTLGQTTKADSLNQVLRMLQSQPEGYEVCQQIASNQLDLAGELLYQKPDTVNMLLDESRKLAEKFGITTLVANGEYLRGLHLQDKELFLESNEALIRYKDFYQRQKPQDNAIKSKLINADASIANNYTYLGKYKEALELHFEVLNFYQSKNDSYRVGCIYTNIAMVYAYKGDWPKQIEYSNMSNDIALKLDDKLGLATNYSNLVQSYKKLNQIDKAFEMAKKGLDINRTLGNKYGVVRSLSGLSNLAIAIKDYVSAISYCEEYLILNEELKQNSSPIIVLCNLGESYQKIGEDQKAKDTFEKANSYLDENTEPTIRRMLFSHLSGYYENIKNYEKALEYRVLRDEVNEQIMDEETTRKLAQTEAKYENELKTALLNAEYSNEILKREHLLSLSDLANEKSNAEVELLDREKTMAELESLRLDVEVKLQKESNEKAVMNNQLLAEENANTTKMANVQTRQKRLALFFSISMLLMSGYAFYSFVKKKKLSVQLQNSLVDLKEAQVKLVQIEKEKEAQNLRLKISRDIHDDIGSTLTKMALLSDISRSDKTMNAEKIEASLGQIGNYARNVNSALSEIVWAISPKHDNLDSVLLYMRSYIHKYFELLPIQISIHFPTEKRAVAISPELRTCLFMILKEALNNIVKHAKADSVMISFNLVSNQYKLTITDNGIGISEGARAKYGNGLNNMNERAKSVGGAVTIVSDNKGTALSINGLVD